MAVDKVKIDKIKFLTYAWSYWTTSFRVSEMKYKIERQLLILQELWWGSPWDKAWLWAQEEYYELLSKEDWMSEDAPDPQKVARTKTSWLRDIWLIKADRRLTEVWMSLLQYLDWDINERNNYLWLSYDSFLYLKQFLKIEFSEFSWSNSYKWFRVNPLLMIIYIIIELWSVTRNIFAYVLQTINSHKELEQIILSIQSNQFDTREYLIKKMMSIPA